jgi:hypothetical protein
MRDTLASWWYAFANAVGGFIEEAAFRVALPFKVLIGRMPLEVERRWWNRATETPTLIDVYDWTNERHIFSVLVWPVLEAPPERAAISQEERVELVREVLHRGAAEMALTTRYETDYGLRWDHERRVWTTEDGFAYDGERLYDYSRSGAV